MLSRSAGRALAGAGLAPSRAAARGVSLLSHLKSWVAEIVPNKTYVGEDPDGNKYYTLSVE